MGTDESNDEPSMLDILKSAMEAEDPSQLDTILSATEMLDPDEFRALHTELIKIYSEKKETDSLLSIVDGILSQAQIAVLTKDTKNPMVGNWGLDLDVTRAEILEKAVMTLISLHVEAGKTPEGRDVAAFELNRLKQRLDKCWEGEVEGEVSMKKKWLSLSTPMRRPWERAFAKARGALDTAINEIGALQAIKEKAPMPPVAPAAAKHAPRLRT